MSSSLYLLKEGFVLEPHQLTFVQIKSAAGWRICTCAAVDNLILAEAV